MQMHDGRKYILFTLNSYITHMKKKNTKSRVVKKGKRVVRKTKKAKKGASKRRR